MKQLLHMRQTRRAFVGALGAAALATKVGRVAAADAPEVTIWMQQVSIQSFNDAVKLFSSKNPEIKLKWVPTPIDQVATKLLTTIAAKSGAPDIAFVQYNDMVNFVSRDGAGLVDVGPFMQKSSESGTDTWVKWALDLATTKSGKVVGVPSDLGVEGTFYRRDLFQAAGLPSEPDAAFQQIATWDDYIAAGKKVVATGKYMLDNAFNVFEIARQQGKQTYFDADGKPIVDSPEFVAAAELAVKIREAKLDLRVQTLGPESIAALKAGKVATYFSAAWFDIFLHADAPETSGQWGVMTLPQGAAGNNGGSYFVIIDQSKNQDAAWTVSSFLNGTKEGVTAHIKQNKFLPAWTPIFKDPIFTDPDPFYGNQAWLQQFVKGIETIPVILPDKNDPIAAEVVSKAVTDILDSGANVKSRLSQANDEIASRIRS